MPADAGIRFGQYVLVRRIARGGMAEVFLAQQRGLEGFDRRVAVKRILPHLADSPDFVKMFLGEAKLAAQLSHPNVVHIYEFGKVEHDYFIAMEFVEGVHAGQLFKQTETEKLSPTMIARIGADAANALHYAHELRGPNGKLYGLVHRDVSPANIMLSYDGVVKLCDFGIAKAVAAGDQLTNPGQVKGKYAYMSPEQTIASQLDGRSDVFSLAIVLWELLAGKYIVQRGDAVAAMRAIRDGKLEPIRAARPDIPEALSDALMWALETKREKRATAADLAQALEAFIKVSPELATSMQLGSWVRMRFPREGTGQQEALSPGASHGTQASPGTVAAPGTVGAGVGAASLFISPESVGASTALPVTPVYPARRVVKVVEDSVEGTEIYSTSDLEESATIKGPRPRPNPFATPSSGSANPFSTPSDAKTVLASPHEEATVHAGPPLMVGDATEIVDPRHLPRPTADDEDSMNATLLDPRSRDSIPSGPTARLPGKPVSGPQPSMPSPLGGSAFPHGGPLRTAHTIRGTGAQGGLGPRKQSSPDVFNQRRGTALTADQAASLRRRKLIITIAGLAGLMLLSFMIALAASSSGERPIVTPEDAEVIEMTEDALPVAPPPLDAGMEPTVPVDAAPGAAMAYLVVRTIPDGGTVKVGDQVRVAAVQPGDPTGAATAQLLLEAGRHTVTAELAGYQSERREVVIDRGENKTIEITFTKKIVARPDRGPPMGRLTVRTTPWSDVYIGSKKLGQAPFADLEVAVGTYTLTFKNPMRPTVTKTVTIKAGKPTKLNFSFP